VELNKLNLLILQNWSHVISVVDQLNMIPTKQHGTDFMRIREWLVVYYMIWKYIYLCFVACSDLLCFFRSVLKMLLLLVAMLIMLLQLLLRRSYFSFECFLTTSRYVNPFIRRVTIILHFPCLIRYLNGQARYYRQTILLSNFVNAGMQSDICPFTMLLWYRWQVQKTLGDSCW